MKVSFPAGWRIESAVEIADTPAGTVFDVTQAGGEPGVVKLLKPKALIDSLRGADFMAWRDGNTGDHIERVAGVAELIAEGIGLDRIRRRNIYLATPLHDIGKIGIPDALLLKPGKLEPHEIEKMREHVPIGVNILRNSSAELARVAVAIIGGHHEKWDGTGYPNGLKGEQIPIEARIVAVADVFDALCSERPYKKAWPIEEAYREILACSGTHFDPACVTAFREKWPQIRKLCEAKGQDAPETAREAG